MIIGGKEYASLTLADKLGNVIFSVSDADVFARTEGTAYFEEKEGQVKFRSNGKKVKIVADEGTPCLMLQKVE